MVSRSIATSARPNTKSLRATVPESIAEYLKLEEGDELEWEMESDENERIAVVRKIKGDKKKK